MAPIGQKIRQLRISEVPQAVRASESALSRDPLQLYIRNTPEPSKNYYAEQWRIVMGVQFAAAVRKGKAWTVGDVLAVMIYEPADEAKDIADKVLDHIWSIYKRSVPQRILSEVQLRRRDEYTAKFDSMIKETLGEGAKTMYYLELLMTPPEHQGHGYGSALARLLTSFADTHGRASWLLSSNIDNTAFYNSLGFVTKAQVSLGDDDPDWSKPPVIVSLMVREVPEKVGSTDHHDSGSPIQPTEA